MLITNINNRNSRLHNYDNLLSLDVNWKAEYNKLDLTSTLRSYIRFIIDQFLQIFTNLLSD